MPRTINVSARCSLRTAIYLVAASVAVSCTAARAQESDLPGVEQVFAGYRANCGTFYTLHVIMTERTKYTEDYAAWHKAQADELEEFARGKDTPEARRQTIRAQAQSMRDLTSLALDEQRHANEFFTDRIAYQFRRPIEFPAPEQWMFSKVPLNAESLLKEFGNVQILTYAPAVAPSVWLWSGTPAAGLPSTMCISNKRLVAGALRVPLGQ